MTKLLLHICCAPDEAWVVKSLKEDYELTCFFCNPNIAPAQEYHLRLAEAAGVADRFKVGFAASVYDSQLWENAIAGYEESPEGGSRCRQCFLLRLRATAHYCAEIGWPTFTTVMSVSPHKNMGMLTEIGTMVAVEYGLTFAPFDFKKKNGFLNSIRLSEELGLYRQDYCGCRLSKMESEERKSRKKQTS